VSTNEPCHGAIGAHLAQPTTCRDVTTRVAHFPYVTSAESSTGLIADLSHIGMLPQRRLL
jgi:hypothetical protein